MSNIANDMVDNLNRNVMRDHIEFVEKGIREKDEDYEKFKKIEKHLVSLEAFRAYLSKKKK